MSRIHALIAAVGVLFLSACGSMSTSATTASATDTGAAAADTGR